MITRLPIELQRHIYGFDPTYREKFDIVLSYVQRKAWIEWMIRKELLWLDTSSSIKELVWLNTFPIWFVRVYFQNEEYAIHFTGEFPWEQPEVSCRGKRLPRVDWTPACTLDALLRTYDFENRLKNTSTQE